MGCTCQSDGYSHVKSKFLAFCIKIKIDLVVLPSHASHITQPLDVSVFGPLKQAISAQNDLAVRYGIDRMRKVDWVVGLAHARRKAVIDANIKSGFKNAAIYPFNPSKFVRLLPLSSPANSAHLSTPAAQSSLTPLASIASENRTFILDNPHLNTPVKRRLYTTSDALERSQSELFLFRQELQGYQAAMESQKRPRGGVNFSNCNTHVFSTDAMFRTAQEHEEATQSRKRGRMVQRQASDSPDPLEEDVFYDY